MLNVCIFDSTASSILSSWLPMHQSRWEGRRENSHTTASAHCTTLSLLSLSHIGSQALAEEEHQGPQAAHSRAEVWNPAGKTGCVPELA
jgi:hypothetical protein